MTTFSPAGTPGDGSFIGSSGIVSTTVSDTMDGGDSEEKDTSLAIGVGVGVGVGGAVLAVAVLVIIIGMTVVIKTTHKRTKEAPFMIM